MDCGHLQASCVQASAASRWRALKGPDADEHTPMDSTPSDDHHHNNETPLQVCCARRCSASRGVQMAVRTSTVNSMRIVDKMLE